MPADGRIARGLGTRERLRDEALRLFAEKGYAQTSTREICAAAGANPASIHYYFRDKAGLYRYAYLAPISQLINAAIAFAQADEPFEAIMRRSYEAFLAPLKAADDKTMQLMKLHFREQADPTGLVGSEVLMVAQAHFDAVAAMLCRELALSAPDDDLRRLAITLIGLATDFLTSADWIRQVSPGLCADHEAIDRMTDRLTGYAVALLAHERSRRGEGRRAMKTGSVKERSGLRGRNAGPRREEANLGSQPREETNLGSRSSEGGGA